MFYNLSPLYLSSLVATLVQNASYFQSFLTLSEDIRNVDTVESFKRRINQDIITIPKYFYTGLRQLQILHTRLRTGCCSLNNDLFLKHIVDSPLCACMSGEIENAEHYFLKCRRYDEYRLELYREVTQYSDVTLNVLLKGKETLSVETTSTFSKQYKHLFYQQKDFKCYVQVNYDFRVLLPSSSSSSNL